ncbi:MAG: lysophospholipid acyltransferase family protein [Chitinophagaceae bacterium]
MYYLIYIPLYLISLLPLRALYMLSDMLYVIIYKVVKYRKAVVRSNLEQAFPQKSPAERRKIEQDFYLNFTDTLVETIKFLSWNKAAFDSHFSLDLSGLEKAYASQKSIYLVGMHNFNWEYANWGLSEHLRYPLLVVYLPVANPSIDRLIVRTRSRFGNILIPATTFRQAYTPYRNKRHILATIADQSPGDPAKSYWLLFFGKETPFSMGMEKGARYLDAAVVFAHFYKVKRGHYRLDTHFVSDAIKTWPEGTLTRQYASFIETCLQQQPANYLWSHRRWKHGWKEGYDPALRFISPAIH